MIFDTHAHYDDEAFDEDREALLSGLAAGGIGTVVNVGADMESTKTTIELTKRYPFIYGAAGVHPSSTAELDEEKFAELRVLAQSDKIVAIGEIGLDYYWEEPDHETQKKWFYRQLNLAPGIKTSSHHPQPRRGEGYARYHEGRALRGDRRRDSLLLLWKRDGGRVFKDGLLLRHRWCTDLQEREKASGGGGNGTFGSPGTGDRLPVSGSGSKPRQTQLFAEPAICGRKAGRNQEMYTGGDRPCD